MYFILKRSSTPQVINKLTLGVFSCLSRMMSEQDRKVFAILLSMEVMKLEIILNWEKNLLKIKI
jgi:hypothetical protein